MIVNLNEEEREWLYRLVYRAIEFTKRGITINNAPQDTEKANELLKKLEQKD